DAGLLDAAERRDLRRNDADVDADDTGLEPLGHAPYTADVAAVEVRGKAILRVVREADQLVLGLEAIQRRDRSEGFLVRDLHRRRDVGEHRGLEELAALLVALAAGEDARTLGQRIGDVLLHFLDRLRLDQRTLHYAGFQPVADLHCRYLVGELLRESLVHAVLHEDTIRADAGLPGVAELRGERAFDGAVEMGVGEPDEGRVAAELERDLLHRARALRHQLLAHFGRAGERELAHERVGRQLLADGARRAGDDAQHALGYAGA